MTRIDLNADLGEGGSQDAALLALVSSANIACGGHKFLRSDSEVFVMGFRDEAN